MDKYAERRKNERVYTFPGLIGGHVVLFFLASWYYKGLFALLSLEIGIIHVSAVLGLTTLYFAYATYDRAQARSVDHQLAIDPRFDESSQFCNICNMVKPLRTKHCKTCEVCCERFDHHCILIGVCVGRHNHGHFVTMLFIDVFYLISLLLTMLYGWFVHGGFYGPLVVFLLIFVIACPAGLLIFHLYMVSSNQTTWEWLSRDKVYYLASLDEEILPFDLGCFGNLREFFWRMKRSSYFWYAPDEVYQEDYEPPQNCCNNKHYSCF